MNYNYFSSHLLLSKQLWSRLIKNPLYLLSLTILVVIFVACFVGPFFLKYSYYEQDLYKVALPPNKEHWFGTDLLGRDLLSRILYGGRISFLVGIFASLVALGIGVTYGAVAGWVGGWLDSLLMRIVEIIYSLPYTIFVILLMVFIGRGLTPLFLAIGSVEWLTMARIVRGQVLFIKGQQFVEASKTLGQSNKNIIFKHLIPNTLSTIIICLTLTVPNVMLLESLISFLGLGVQAPMTSWGDLIKEGSLAMETSPWLIIFPSFFFFSTLFSLNFLGDSIRDAFDPHS